ncbi:MAG: YihY/virulence factor BrkB family protein [Phycisphaerales bacterium]|nr:YihY/virulence factor BrkB family protein [Phycisphaerales bacterium]
MPLSNNVPTYKITIFVANQLNKVGLFERAAAIAFNIILALPAGCIFLFTIAPYLPGSQYVKITIFYFLKGITPNTTSYHLVQGILDDLLNKHIGLFSFSFILLMFYASNAMLGIIRTFDRSIFQKKNFFLHKRWRAIKLTLILIGFSIICLFILIAQQRLLVSLSHNFVINKSNLIWFNRLRSFIIILSIYLSIGLIYKFGPSVKKRWPIISLGAIIATIAMILSTLLFSYWLNNFNSYNKIYGSLGTVLITNMFIYFNALLLIIGFEINVGVTILGGHHIVIQPAVKKIDKRPHQ